MCVTWLFFFRVFFLPSVERVHLPFYKFNILPDPLIHLVLFFLPPYLQLHLIIPAIFKIFKSAVLHRHWSYALSIYNRDMWPIATYIDFKKVQLQIHPTKFYELINRPNLPKIFMAVFWSNPEPQFFQFIVNHRVL